MIAMEKPIISHPRKWRILVVEDEALIAMDIGMQVEGLGYEWVGQASSGEQAIELAGELRPDLVLMDVHLGTAMDGIDAAQAIRTRFDLPCIFLSAFSGEENIARAERTDPAGCLGKPFLESDLRTLLEAAFRAR